MVGSDKLEYDRNTGVSTASLIETKLLINSVISGAKEGARFISCNLKDLFLETHMNKAEYIKISYKYISEDIR